MKKFFKISQSVCSFLPYFHFFSAFSHFSCTGKRDRNHHFASQESMEKSASFLAFTLSALIKLTGGHRQTYIKRKSTTEVNQNQKNCIAIIHTSLWALLQSRYSSGKESVTKYWQHFDRSIYRHVLKKKFRQFKSLLRSLQNSDYTLKVLWKKHAFVWSYLWSNVFQI